MACLLGYAVNKPGHQAIHHQEVSCESSLVSFVGRKHSGLVCTAGGQPFLIPLFLLIGQTLRFSCTRQHNGKISSIPQCTWVEGDEQYQFLVGESRLTTFQSSYKGRDIYGTNSSGKVFLQINLTLIEQETDFTNIRAQQMVCSLISFHNLSYIQTSDPRRTRRVVKYVDKGKITEYATGGLRLPSEVNYITSFSFSNIFSPMVIVAFSY
jgi:hypothetical protein